MIIIIASGGQTEEETRWRPEEATSGVPDRWPCRLPPPPEVTPQVGQGRGHRKMVGSRAQRGLRAQAAAAAEEEEQEPPVILISDEDSDEGHGASVLLLAEPLEDSVLEEEKSEEIVDEESGLVVTFCKKGNVMPHARYDCMTNLFERAECETCIPLERNAETCGQCYCYICDKPASECQSWTTPALCHCNAHNKSKYWKGQRDFTLAGVLATFNLELSEIDRDLRRGGELLIQFVQDLSVEYTKYLGGESLALGRQDCFCQPKRKADQCDNCRWIETEMVYRYSSVFQKVSSFISQAEEESPKTAAVMLLGAIKEISLHKDPARNWQNLGPTESLKIAVPSLMDSIPRGQGEQIPALGKQHGLVERAGAWESEGLPSCVSPGFPDPRLSSLPKTSFPG
uniref:Uncharacterized protein n=1 Tax=Ornithorhynchus anatinus TaxID=9258 RepID=A0A6I8NUP7_ORNAN